VAEECKKSRVSLTELRSGSRRGRLPAVRTKIVRGLVENYGVGVAEVARQVGISTSGVSKILTRTLFTLVNSVISHHISRACGPSFS
jgi:putative transposase